MVCPHHQFSRAKDLPVPPLRQPDADRFNALCTDFLNYNIIAACFLWIVSNNWFNSEVYINVLSRDERMVCAGSQQGLSMAF